MSRAVGGLQRQVALGLVSAALLAQQIILMQLLATSQWHHFASLVISIALLGFGLAGSLLAIARERLLRYQSTLLPLLLIACALTLVAPLDFARQLFGGFDSYLLFVSFTETLKLALTALLLMLPFACGALCIGMIFTAGADQIGRFYCANLLGSGLGCLLGLGGLNLLSPESLPPFCACLSIVAATLLIENRPRALWAGTLLVLLTVAFTLAKPTSLEISQYKDLRRALDLPDAELLARQPAAAGEVHIVSSPALRSAPGVSLQWQNEIVSTPAVFINGNAYGSTLPAPGKGNPLDATPQALPYALGPRLAVLSLYAGTGTSVAQAIQHDAQRVVAVEPHKAVLPTLVKALPEAYAPLLNHPKIEWQNVSPRSWLARDETGYDLINLPILGSFGGNAGLFALLEQPLLTREAFSEAFERLTPGGYLTVTTWLDYPVRRPLRLLTTLRAAMEDLQMERPRDHIAALRSWGTITFCVKRTPLTQGELAAIRRFALRWGFDPALLPDLKATERQKFHLLEDDQLLVQLETILDGAKDDLLASYPFRIEPATDDRPFFGQFLRWRHLPELTKIYGTQTVPFLETGLLIAALSALTLSGLAVLLILLPLFKLPKRSRQRITFLYFGGLGLGYMWLELALIHQFATYLDHAITAAAMVICALLIGSGFGSHLSGSMTSSQTRRWAGLIVVMITAYALSLGPLLTMTLHYPQPLRILISLLIILPLAILMGVPFPLGLRLLDSVRSAEVPWAWGINGCLSVVGAAFATLIAVEAGYSVLLLSAAAAYLFPALVRLN